MRKRFLLLSFLSLSIVLLVISCNRDNDANPGTGGNTDAVVDDAVMVTGGITGIVVDQNNLPVSGATVKSGTNTTTTDIYGSFRFRNINLSKANGTVKVEKTGFFTGYRTFVSVAGRNNNVRIKLLPKSNTGSFTASSGGTINLTGGGKLVVPVNALTDASGTAYSGNVNVAMTWIDPSSADLPYTLMGDLRGITTTGIERGLSTYGMLGVEMTGSANQVLKLASGKTAELTFPIPASLQSSAAATIDLWHFDEVTARWKQEGTATRIGNNYVAMVSHFSFWNCDGQFPVIDLCLSFRTATAQPLINAQVRIKRVVNNTYGYGRTDSSGNLCGKVPWNEALVLEIVDLCNVVIYSQNIGPFTSNTSLSPITVTVPAINSLVIAGTVTNCANANVTNGAAAIYVAGGNYYVVPVTNGVFSLSLIRCTNATVNFSVLGIDYSTNQQSNTVSGSGTTGTINTGVLQACGTSSSEYIDLLIDGRPYSFISPRDTLRVNDNIINAQYQFVTSIYGDSRATGRTTKIDFTFFNDHITGPAPLGSNNSCLIILAGLNGAPDTIGRGVTNANPVVNITNFGLTTGSFIEGNFNFTELFDVQFTAHSRNVVGTFRLRRP